MCMIKIHCMYVWSSQVISKTILKSNNKLIRIFISYLNIKIWVHVYKFVYIMCTLCMCMSWKSSNLCCLRSTNYSYSVWVPLFFCFCPSAMLTTLNSYCPLHYPTKQGLLYAFIRYNHHGCIKVIRLCFQLAYIFIWKKAFFLSLSPPFFLPSFLPPSLFSHSMPLSFFFLSSFSILQIDLGPLMY